MLSLIVGFLIPLISKTFGMTTMFGIVEEIQDANVLKLIN